MTERKVVLDEPTIVDESAEAIRQATERAERAEKELARLKQEQGAGAKTTSVAPDISESGEAAGAIASNGRQELEKDAMMAHLISALEAGEDIGHYGRLTFCMVARHFLDHQEMIDLLGHDHDFSAEEAEALLAQVESHGYNPPRRDRIVQWQSEQEFQILPTDDPDAGNVYRTLKFPDGVYKHIEGYQAEKAHNS